MYEPIDQDGNKIIIGTKVRMLVAPKELISGLPASDQSAIQAIVGKVMIVKNFDKYGHAELRFRDKHKIIHYIWVRPSALQVVSQSCAE
jgi:hypothetical protein